MRVPYKGYIPSGVIKQFACWEIPVWDKGFWLGKSSINDEFNGKWTIEFSYLETSIQ